MTHVSGVALSSLILLAACGQADAPADNQAVAGAAAPAPTGAGEVSAAERLVRERLGNPQGLTVANPRRTASEGVTIVCGDYVQGSVTRRYIVVDSTDLFLESELQPGEMDRYFAEFCVEGSGNRPAPVALQGNSQ